MQWMSTEMCHFMKLEACKPTLAINIGWCSQWLCGGMVKDVNSVIRWSTKEVPPCLLSCNRPSKTCQYAVTLNGSRSSHSNLWSEKTQMWRVKIICYLHPCPKGTCEPPAWSSQLSQHQQHFQSALGSYNTQWWQVVCQCLLWLQWFCWGWEAGQPWVGSWNIWLQCPSELLTYRSTY